MDFGLPAARELVDAHGSTIWIERPGSRKGSPIRLYPPILSTTVLKMMKKEHMTYPIMEFDPTHNAMVEPSRLVRPGNVPEHCVICFFREVIDKVVTEHKARKLVENPWEDGPHPVYEILYQNQRLAFFHPGIGEAMSAGLVEEVIASGCRKFIA